MADRVIISDVNRQGHIIPSNEIMQMSGRCGRKIGEGGNVNLIINEDDFEEVKQQIKKSESLAISSVMDEYSAAFHIVSEIDNNNIKTKSDIENWYKRSFAFSTDIKINVNMVLDMLVEYEAIKISGETLQLTKYANISSKYYFHPADIFTWKQNFDNIFQRGLEKDNSATSWALSNIPLERSKREALEYYNYLDQYKSELSSIDLEQEALSTGLIYWTILNGIGLGKIRNTVRSYQGDFQRVVNAIKEIYPDRLEFFEELSLRIKYKAGDELLPLLKLENMTKNLASELYNLGVECIEDIEDNLDSIELYGSEKLKQYISILRYCND